MATVFGPDQLSVCTVVQLAGTTVQQRPPLVMCSTLDRSVFSSTLLREHVKSHQQEELSNKDQSIEYIQSQKVYLLSGLTF